MGAPPPAPAAAAAAAPAKSYAAPAFFKDFGKLVTDTLKPSKYDVGKQVEVKSKTSSGVALTANGTLLDGDAPGKITLKSANIGLKDAEFEGELHTTGKVLTKLTTTRFAKGLKLVASNEALASKSTSLHLVEALYSTQSLAVTASAQSNLFKDYKVDGSIVLSYQGLAIGGAGTYKDAAVTDYNAGAEYTDADFKLTLKTQNKADKVVASYSHVVSPSATVVSSFAYDLGKSSPGKEFSIGGTYKVDADSTLTSVYTSKGLTGVVSALYEVNINKDTKVGLATVIDLQDTTRQKFGIKLTLG